MIISIKKQLDESNVTRYEFAKKINVSYPTIDKIYKGETSSIKLNTLESICKGLNCTPNDILLYNKDDLQ